MKRFLKYWAPLYLYAGFIFYMSSLPHPLPKITIPHFDRFLHIIEYAIFGILAARAFKNSQPETVHKNFKILAILTAVVYGASDEFHQLFVSSRDCSVFDLIADLAGGTIGALIYSIRCMSLRAP